MPIEILQPNILMVEGREEEFFFGALIEKPRHLSKAKVQAFLASRQEAGKRLGEAAQAGYWPWNNKAFDQVKNFLQQIVS